MSTRQKSTAYFPVWRVIHMTMTLCRFLICQLNLCRIPNFKLVRAVRLWN
jgi:hypothetical protein